jgi:hypothetical protein
MSRVYLVNKRRFLYSTERIEEDFDGQFGVIPPINHKIIV